MIRPVVRPHLRLRLVACLAGWTILEACLGYRLRNEFVADVAPILGMCFLGLLEAGFCAVAWARVRDSTLELSDGGARLRKGFTLFEFRWEDVAAFAATRQYLIFELTGGRLVEVSRFSFLNDEAMAVEIRGRVLAGTERGSLCGSSLLNRLCLRGAPIQGVVLALLAFMPLYGDLFARLVVD